MSFGFLLVCFPTVFFFFFSLGVLRVMLSAVFKYQLRTGPCCLSQSLGFYYNGTRQSRTRDAFAFFAIKTFGFASIRSLREGERFELIVGSSPACSWTTLFVCFNFAIIYTKRRWVSVAVVETATQKHLEFN